MNDLIKEARELSSKATEGPWTVKISEGFCNAEIETDCPENKTYEDEACKLMENNGYWYCHHCRVEVDCHTVTYQELHETCGHQAVWIENNGITPDRICELVNAEREQRLVVLPCKVGQIIWFIGIDYTKCSAYGEEYDDVSCAGCEKECDSQKTYNVYATKAESLDWILRRTGSFGTTYFITHEAAQAALGKEQ